jgi:hemolysin activation/secretion protein
MRLNRVLGILATLMFGNASNLHAAEPGKFQLNPAAATQPAKPQPAPPSAPPEPQTLRFDISGFRVEGNTLVAASQIAEVLKPFEGKARDFGDVQRALEALQETYAQAGFGAVQVYLPEQELQGGVVSLKVIETRIEKINIVGNKNFDAANIRRSLPALKEGATPNSRDLADNLRVANESPVKQARVILRPGKTDGNLEAQVEVEDQSPWRLFTTLDNTGTKQTGNTRLGFGVQHANLFDRDHVLTAQYITSPEKPSRVSVYSLGYRLPLYSLGHSIDAFAGYSDVDAGTTDTPFGQLEFKGKGTVSGIRYNWIFDRRGEYEHRLIIGLDYRIYDNVCSVGSLGAGSCGAAAANVQVHPISLTYSGQLTRASTQGSVYVSALQNIAGGKDGTEEALRRSRSQASGGYRVLRLGSALASAVGGDWQARLRLDAQVSSDALVQGEQFGVGGWNSVRGFHEREIANDKGYSGSIEFYTPNLAKWSWGLADNLRGLVFVDGGSVQRNKPEPGDTKKDSASSVGFGLRASDKKDFSVRADVARVTKAGGAQTKGEVRGHFGILVSF